MDVTAVWLLVVSASEAVTSSVPVTVDWHYTWAHLLKDPLTVCKHFLCPTASPYQYPSPLHLILLTMQNDPLYLCVYAYMAQAVVQLVKVLRYSQKVAGSISDGVGICH